MKKIIFISIALLVLNSCSENKNKDIPSASENNKIKIESDKALRLPNAEKYVKEGYVLSPKIAIYDDSLKEIDSLKMNKEITIVDILERTKEMITASGDTLNQPCPTANFLKIKYNNKEYITYGVDIYKEIKDECFNVKNNENEISLYSLRNFTIGFSGFGELTGCDDYHPLIIKEGNEFHKIHSIPKNDYYAKENNMNYYYLNWDDGTRENVENVSLKYDTIVAKIHIEYQDGYSDYDLNITKNNGTFKSVISNETEPKFD